MRSTILFSCFLSCHILLRMWSGVPSELSIPNMVLHVSIVLAWLPPVSAVSPLNLDQYCREPSHHPNPQLVSSVLDGIRHGFKLGFSHH